MSKQETYKALSKICLNNWHYIEHKVLSLNEDINFFTGHSGSGKSTVIDALQIVLYANTDGRGFFNKAAADDSDRSLIEYLRGMVSIGEDNAISYLRNKNFSSTIVLELENTKNREKECVGIVFDVETATNEISRLFFWHKGPLLEKEYLLEERCMITSQVREYLQRNFSAEEQFYTSNNERFRRNLYDIYLGGLDMEKFPRLFKRAIPFRMNIKLEEFVKEYICMEQDIHIEDMQESVMQYGRMRKKIEDTLTEIGELQDIQKCYATFQEKNEEDNSLAYRMKRLEMRQLEERVVELKERISQTAQEQLRDEEKKQMLECKKTEIEETYREILQRISNSGYDQLTSKLQSIHEFLEQLDRSKVKWNQISEALRGWKEQEITPNQVVWDIEKFEKKTISEGEIQRLKDRIKEISEEVEEEHRDSKRKTKELKKTLTEINEELKTLRGGEKGYPRILEEARYELRNRLRERTGTFVNVRILADLLEIQDESWHNAVEGYLGYNKLALIVEPKYVKDAFAVYEELDKKRFWSVAIVDTERIQQKEREVKAGALAEEVKAKEPYVQAYVNFLLGNVMKCDSVETLRSYRIGVTPDCMLYQNFQLRRMNPEHYTIRAYIGETSLRQRMKLLDEQRKSIQEELYPMEQLVAQTRQLLYFEKLQLETSEYVQMLKDMKRIQEKQREKNYVITKLEQLQLETVDSLKAEQERVENLKRINLDELGHIDRQIWEKEQCIEKYKKESIAQNESLVQLQIAFKKKEQLEQDFYTFLEDKRGKTMESLKSIVIRKQMEVNEKKEEAYHHLVDLRSNYLRKYPNRTFSASSEDNKAYNELLEEMQCDALEKFKEDAKEQAKSAVEHFKDDFIFKIRSAIKEAYQRKDELNRIINKLDFGKDKYQFKITKNKGFDGEYYKMFMDDSLQINPSSLTNTLDNQMNIFTMEHEDNYGEMMNDLINIFIPPDGASPEELEEAKRNMDKYADYRTYLSFDMEQIVQGSDQEKLTIGLSKMIKKNSGGEGQNPLYVALLASFAQAYKVGLSPKLQRNPTLRLVILDEAFSKMDAEKVASCIALIRGLGFQAIISATNDKIQNYLENVDKTFVYANPNKKSISIQEFEKIEFGELITEDER